MTILAIETTAKMGGISILKKGEILAESMHSGFETYCSRLVPEIENMLYNLNISWKDLTGVAISIGPGSFTGLRIGMATAKAICFSLDIPIFGIPTLDALAMNITPSQDLLICPVIDARKEQIYAAIYTYKDNKLTKISPYMAIKPIEFVKTLSGQNEKICFLGDGLIKYKEIFNSFFQTTRCFASQETLNYVKASNIAYLAWLRSQNGQKDNSFTLQPIYIRPSDAEVKKIFPDKDSPVFYE